MPSPLAPALGQRTWLGMGKQPDYATAVAPVIFHGAESNTPTPKITYIDRPGPRAIGDETLAAPGPFMVNMSAKIEPDPDTLPQLLAYAFGVQSAPALSSPSTIAYASSLTLGTLKFLPYFTAEYFADNACFDIEGCAIDTLTLGMKPGGKLTADLGIVGRNIAIQGSPASPTFSVLLPYQSEAPGSGVTYNGTVVGVDGQPTTQAWTLKLNNQLDKNYRRIGDQLVAGFPVGVRKVSGSLQLGFENYQAYTDFMAQGTVSLLFSVFSRSIADPVGGVSAIPLPYQASFYVPNARLIDHNVPQKTSGPLSQTVNFQGYHLSGGSPPDALQGSLITLASAIY